MLINALSYTKKTNGVFVRDRLTNTSFAPAELKSSDMVKMSTQSLCNDGVIDDLRAEYGEITFGKTFSLLKDILNSWIDTQNMIHDLKFSLYIVCLLIIFILLWKKMVSNMQMDIVKALGILNILPTAHLGAHPDFIRDMNKSSLIN